MLKDGLRQFLQRRMLLIGFLAVLVPLSAMLVLQYRWLTRLEKTSAIAEKAWLSAYLEAVSTEVEYFYRSEAARVLSVPSYYLSDRHRDKLGQYLLRKSLDGGSYLFVVKYVDKEEWGDFVGLDPRSGRLGLPEDEATYRAIGAALSPWRTLAYKGAPVPSHEPVVDELDPWNRLILNPITDDACQLLGIAGMVVDNDYFRSVVLPAAIEKSLPKFFDEKAQANLVITARDRMDRLVIGSESNYDEPNEHVTTTIPFVFSDWTLALGSRYATPEEWAKSNFMLNISLSAMVGLVLLGGIVLALRTASREMRLGSMKSDFVSNVSHELRTPLASIRVFGEFMRLGRVSDESKIREYGEYIETESRRLTQLIDNILDFSKIESGAKSYQFEEIDLRDVVGDACRTMEVGLKHKGIRIVQRHGAVPPRPVRIDPGAIGQALANLVDNAAKYSGAAREVQVGLEAGKDEVVISVRDHGIGISKEEQTRIFDRFHRVGTGLVHDVRGSGLGLSIVNHIVQAHGGRVSVESDPGRGSVFRIHLPVTSPAADARPRRVGPLTDPAS